MKFNTLPVVGGNPATLLAEFDEVCTIINSDSTNFVVLADNNAAQPTDQQIAPLGPGQYITLDGSSQCYGVTPQGVNLTVFKYPGAVQLGTTGVGPTATPGKLVSEVANAPGFVTLINAPSVPVQLISLTISVIAFGTAGFTGIDAIVDSAMQVYLPIEVGLPSAGGGPIFPSLSVTLPGVVMPAGRSLLLSNGGGGAGITHSCTAMVSYYLVNQFNG